MFFARWDQGGPWSSRGIEGTWRWLKRLWTLVLEPFEHSSIDAGTSQGLRRKVHQTLAQVTDDFENYQFNTIVAALMELMNEMNRSRSSGGVATEVWDEAVDIYLRMMAPVTPHIAEELWHRLGKPGSVHLQSWPRVDPEAIVEDEVTLIVQVNGKVRDRLSISASATEDDAKEMAIQSEGAQRFTEGKTIRKVIYVPGRLVNIVAS
jgi:leucyl-tRNA synthetase